MLNVVTCSSDIMWPYFEQNLCSTKLKHWCCGFLFMREREKKRRKEAFPKIFNYSSEMKTQCCKYMIFASSDQQASLTLTKKNTKKTFVCFFLVGRITAVYGSSHICNCWPFQRLKKKYTMYRTHYHCSSKGRVHLRVIYLTHCHSVSVHRRVFNPSWKTALCVDCKLL